jgi:hypothetical protein
MIAPRGIEFGANAALTIPADYTGSDNPDAQQSNAVAGTVHPGYSMRRQQGLAVITRTEHWDMASQHLWGLSSSDIAAYLHSTLPHTDCASAEPTKTESCSNIASPVSLGDRYGAIPRDRKIEPATANQEI